MSLLQNTQTVFFSLNLTLRPWPKPEARRAVLGLFPAAAPAQIQGGSTPQTAAPFRLFQERALKLRIVLLLGI